MNPPNPNFIIQDGPEKGREISIPAEGARIGRAEENDIRIADPAMSRFQCRMYYRDGFLHIMDLGSTNESLVNGQPVTDQILRYGDEVWIGESVLKVVQDGLAEQNATPPAPVAEAAPAPIIFQPEVDPPAPTPGAVPAEPAAAASADPSASQRPELDNVDLGLGRREAEEDPTSPQNPRSVMPLLLVTLVTTLVVFSVGIIVLMSGPAPETAPAATTQEVQISYERVIAGDGNIFRYALQLSPEGVLSAEIHDLREQRNITREQELSDVTLREFTQQLETLQPAFSQLEEIYSRDSGEVMESNDLTVIFGREAKQVQTRNYPAPSAFTSMQELIEGFARSQLGLSTLNKPPAELRAEAANAWKNALSLYDKKEVKNENLYQAIQKLREVKFLLQDIEPKPDYYDQAFELEQTWFTELKEQVNDMFFEANRALKIGRKEEAVAYLRQILATFPEKSNSAWIEAYNNLVRLEQELK